MKMEQNIDILDRLQDEEGCVKLILTSGKEIYGYPHCIIYEEDDEGWETIKKIKFDVWHKSYSLFLGIEDIKSFEQVIAGNIEKEQN